MPKTSLILITLLLTLLWVVPAFAVVISPAETATSGANQIIILVAEETVTAPTTKEVTTTQGGVQPITPEKIQSKADALENWAVALMTPIIHLMSKMSLILAVLLIFVAVFARQLLGRAFMIIGCVILGMAIFTNVGVITDTIQYMGQWLGQ